MLRAFDNWTRASGAEVSDILPQWKSDEDDYITLNCRVEASGNLNTLSRFLYEIESDPMSVKLDSVELAARDASGQQLTLGLQVSGLVLTPHTHP
jgi:Tfp pilus assembly protein PilO